MADLPRGITERPALLLHKLPEFHNQRTGSFRSWLRVETLNKWRER